jgi:hypothetical protein
LSASARLTEEQRRSLLHALVAARARGGRNAAPSYATDDGVGLIYRGTEMVAAVADRDGAAAYRVERAPEGNAVETRIESRRLS